MRGSNETAHFKKEPEETKKHTKIIHINQLSSELSSASGPVDIQIWWWVKNSYTGRGAPSLPSPNTTAAADKLFKSVHIFMHDFV